MTLAELRAKWEARRADAAALGSLASLASIAADVLKDLEQLERADDRTMTPAGAAAVTHYHPESIGRMIRAGKVRNYGTKHRPLVKVSELPHKAALASTRPSAASSRGRGKDVTAVTPAAIARDAIAGRIGRS